MNAGVVALDHLLLAMPRGKEAEARAFYGGLLGLPELKKPPNLEVRGGVWFALGAQQLHLGVEKEFPPGAKGASGLSGERSQRLARTSRTSTATRLTTTSRLRAFSASMSPIHSATGSNS